MRRITAGLAGAALLLSGVGLTAQLPQPVDAGVPFEVAAIRRNTSGEQGASVRAQPGGRLTITNNTLFNIIRNAYNVQGFQIVGGPDWMDRDRWDITAKAEGDVPPAAMLGMLQRLLAERFKADIRRETREMDVYALVVARPDGALGPQIAPASVDCAALFGQPRAPGTPPPPQPPPLPSGGPACGIRINAGVMQAGGSLLADVARNLSGATGRIIVDQTGLPGRYDLELKWTPDPLQAPSDAGVDRGSIFTALQEQLGLRLEARRAPVDVLVVHAAERPIED